jgi:hypothetical protein
VESRVRASKKAFQSVKVNFEDEGFIMQLMNNLPMEYNSLVEAVEENMNKGLENRVTVKRV